MQICNFLEISLNVNAVAISSMRLGDANMRRWTEPLLVQVMAFACCIILLIGYAYRQKVFRQRSSMEYVRILQWNYFLQGDVVQSTQNHIPFMEMRRSQHSAIKINLFVLGDWVRPKLTINHITLMAAWLPERMVWLGRKGIRNKTL